MITNLSRKNCFLLPLVALLALPLFFPDSLFSHTPVTAPVLLGSGPPSAADWVIASDTVIEDEHYILNGSIVIESGANLTLTNVTLWMKCTAAGEFNITINSGGELYLHNCTVTAYDTAYRWFLAAKPGSTLLLNATTISYTGYDPNGMYDGIGISTDNAQVINCTMSRNYYALMLYQANDTLIKDNNFTLSGISAIECEKANNTIIESNSITNSSGSGIYTHTSYNTTIKRNNITNSAWAGIWLRYSSNSTICENMIADTDIHLYAGIELEESANSTIRDNTITNSGGRGIWLCNSSDSTVYENTVANSDENGIELEASGQSTVSGNTVTNSRSKRAYGRGIRLGTSGNSTVSGNIVSNTDGSGIWLSSSDDNTVSGNTVTNTSSYGIFLGTSSNSTVSGNTITNSSDSGMRLWDSGNSTIRENTVTNSDLYGIDLDESSQSTVSGNTVTNSGWDGIRLNGSDQSTVNGNTVTNTSSIKLLYSAQSTVSGNTVTDSWRGIGMLRSDLCIVTGNTITNNRDGGGMWIAGCAQSTVSGNTITNGGSGGIRLGNSSQSTISGNTITNTVWYGIELEESGQSTITGNTITNSSQYGIYLTQSTSDCLLWENILSMNEKGNAYDGNGTNQWDNGTHGNWYDDYAGPDLNQDGIGDSPYSIDGGLIEDRYPLMNLILPDTSPPTLESPADVTYTVHSTGHTITWQPSDANPFWYQIFRDGVIIANTTWDGAAITLEIDDLAVGTYNYTILVLDRLGYRTTDEVLVTVKPLEEETTEDEEQLIPGFDFPLVGVSLAVGWFLARSRRRKGKLGDSPKSYL